MGDRISFPTVTAPLAHWAERRPSAIAIADDTHCLGFEQMAARVRARAAEIAAAAWPATAWVPADASELDRLVAFCAIAESGRAAAIADPDWPPSLRARVRAALPDAPASPGPPGPLEPFYVGFTSGSTGLPKGFVRNHRSWTKSFAACLSAFGAPALQPVVAPGRLSHSLFLFAMLFGLWTGAGVHTQNRFSAARCLDLLARLPASCLFAVPSHLMLMLEAAERRRERPIGGVRLILIGGARWTRRETPRLQALFPEARIVEFYGASETSFVAWTESRADLPETLVGQPFAGVSLRIGDGDNPSEPGLIHVSSKMLFSGYVLGDDGSLRRDGAAIAVGDVGFVDAAGNLHLLGRQERMIITQGKNLFPEEVEAVLERHPAVAAASVFSMADPLRGSRLMAFVLPRGGACPSGESLSGFCRVHIPAFKVPRRYFVRENWPRTAGGKTDHARLAAEGAAACLKPMS